MTTYSELEVSRLIDVTISAAKIDALLVRRYVAANRDTAEIFASAISASGNMLSSLRSDLAASDPKGLLAAIDEIPIHLWYSGFELYSVLSELKGVCSRLPGRKLVGCQNLRTVGAIDDAGHVMDFDKLDTIIRRAQRDAGVAA